MRTTAIVMAFAMLVAVGCGGKAEPTSTSKNSSTTAGSSAPIKVAEGMKLVKLKLPGMT